MQLAYNELFKAFLWSAVAQPDTSIVGRMDSPEIRNATQATVALRWLIICSLLLWIQGVDGQVRNKLSLAEAYELLEARYPAMGQAALEWEMVRREQEQVDADRRPQLYWKADGRFQSENVNLEASPEMPFPLEISRPLGSAQTYLEADYVLLDGGMADAQKVVLDKQAWIAESRQALTAYELRGRVQQLAIQLEWFNAQVPVLEISQQDLAVRRAQVAAGVAEGVLLPSELKQLQVREVELAAQLEALQYRRAGLIATMEQLLDVELADSVQLIFPELPDVVAIPAIQRPEQQVFAAQRSAILAQEALVEAGRKPKLRLFAQGGLGYPNPLNLLDGDPAAYGLIGAGFSWRLLDWDRSQQQKEVLSLQAQQLQLQEETLLFNLTQAEASYYADVKRLRAQLDRDREIAELQAEILTQLAAQLEEGVITSADYLQQLNTELRARQQLMVHKVELLQTQLNFWHSRGY